MWTRRPRVAEILVEVGFEEMPAPWLPGLAEQMRARFLEASARESLEASDALVAYTPRRLVLRADVPVRQSDREDPIWGPSLKVAKDAAGKWTGAALGFARKNDVAVEELAEGVRDPAKPGERNLLHVRKVAGRQTTEVLPGLLAGVLRALAFPKRMSWDAWLDDGKGAFPFGGPSVARALLDGAVVPFVIHALEGEGRAASSCRAALTRTPLPAEGAGREGFVVGIWDELNHCLRERFVILAPEERAFWIED
jgi:glycyl-tRNA synthetase beta chain